MKSKQGSNDSQETFRYTSVFLQFGVLLYNYYHYEYLKYWTMGNGNNENIESSLEELKKFLTKENTRKVEIGLTSKDDAIKFNLSVDKSKLDVQTKEMVSAFIGAVL